MGDDLSRGLLLFGEAKPLGERGLRWLKIHLSNLYGYDKATFEERVEFVHKHLDDIFDSAENPLHVSRSPYVSTWSEPHISILGTQMVAEGRRPMAMSCYLHRAQVCA
jgi:DNA-directed RNA polymerase